MAKEIWVYAEHNNGKTASVTGELLAKSRALAAEMGGFTVAAVVAVAPATSEVADPEAAVTSEVIKLGAEKIYVLEHSSLAHYRCDVYAAAIAELVKKYNPEYFFIGATAIGSELAPTIAAHLQTGLAAHCIDLRWNGERLNCMVPAFGGKVVSEIYIPDARPVMASVRPGILPAADIATPEVADAEIVTSEVTEFDSGEEFLGFEPNESTAVDIEAADFIVAAGRGAASDTAWNVINELADKFDGAVAYSRSFIDTGKVPDETCMIGTSGKSVRPKVLINAGISGAAQYVCGIGKSKTIISINKKPKAAIFGHSDYGVVGDVDKILPAILEKLT